MNQSDYADHLIDVYLEGLTSVSNDAGWEGDSMMSRLIHFHGEIPRSTGLDQSNTTMINAIGKLRKRHALFDKIKREIYIMLGTAGESDKILSLLSERYYDRTNPKTGKRFKYQDKISNIGYAPMSTGDPIKDGQAWENARRNFRRRVVKARELLLARMDKYLEAA